MKSNLDSIAKSKPPMSSLRPRFAKRGSRLPAALGWIPVLAAALAPNVGWSCACGCGVFDVGTSSMLPQGPGGMFYIDYDFQDQNQNWSGDSRAPAQNNSDKEIRTHWVTAGLQYMFDRSWGVQVEVPYENRYFKTEGGASGSDILSLNWGDLGDIRVKGIYTGFSEDLSSGVTFGFKLPTGSFTHNDTFGDIDRDTEIGTGSTDLLLGGFHRGKLTKNNRWNWFAQAELDLPVLTRDQYRPGFEIDGALGLYYSGWSLGRVSITPVAQVIASERTSDTGAEASGGSLDNPEGGVSSGYQRVLLSPGIEFDIHPVSIYADVELPVFAHTTGNQLVAPALFKLIMSYHF